MGLNKSEIIYTLIVLYAIVFVFLGFAGQYIDTGTQGQDVSYETLDLKFSIIKGINAMPSSFNYVYFGSLTIFISFLLITSLPTFNVH